MKSDELVGGKWEKLPIGKIHGYSIYVELPPLSGQEHVFELAKVRDLFERLWEEHELTEGIIEFIKRRTY